MTAEETYTQATTFIVSSAMLKQAVSKLVPFVQTTPIVPILDNILFEVHSEGSLTMRASRLVDDIEVALPVEGMSSPPLCIPGRDLAKLLATIDEQPITIQTNPYLFKTSLITDTGTYEFTTDNPIDFPKKPTFTPSAAFTLPVEQFREIIRTAYPFTSKDDLRPALTGILFQRDDLGKFEVAATDGHRLLVMNPEIENNAFSFRVLLSRAIASKLSVILPKKGDDVRVEIGVPNESGQFTRARISWGKFSIVTRLIEERFPDYLNAIPTDCKITLAVERLKLMATLRRGMIFSNKATNQLRFEIKDKSLTVIGDNLDYHSSMKERVSIDTETDEEMTIVFNAKLLLETLKQLPEGMIEFHISAPNRPMLIKPINRTKESTTKILVSPVILNTYY